MSVLSLDRVTYTFPGGAAPALADVSLAIEPGEFVVLAGVSGSGKSTLLRAAAGLVPHFTGGTFEGALSTGGLDAREHGPAELSAVAGSLFQDPESQVVMTRVRSEIAFPLENRGWAAPAVARGVEEAALGLGIAGLLDRSTDDLSGGELQRVALAAALAGRPRLVLLDEPTSQLDPVAGDELLGLLRRLNEEWGTAIVLAEHRLERCLPAADRVIALHHGRVVCDTDPAGFQRWAAAQAPRLQTPPARLFSLAGLEPIPVGVKDARSDAATRRPARRSRPRAQAAKTRPLFRTMQRQGSDPRVALFRTIRSGERRRARAEAALAVEGAWYELRSGPALLRDVSLTVAPGEQVALMGRNGAGKSTLLRLAAGLAEPTRGRVRAAGRVALLAQRPGDLFVHDRVDAELSAAALERAGLAELAARHPKDLSGGERQRLALAIALDAPEPPAAVLLDEPTRGMDREHRDELGASLCTLAAAGTAIVVATHDPEFAVAVAGRVVLLGDGIVLADAPASEVLCGGWYFATQTARVLGGAGGALEPVTGAALLRERMQTAVAR